MIIADAHQDHCVIGNFSKKLLRDLKKQTSLELLKKSDINLFFYSIYANPREKEVNQRIGKAIKTAKKELKKYEIVLVRNRSDIGKIKQKVKKTFAILHIEGLYGIKKEADIKYLNRWFSLGVRSFGLAWNEDNSLGGGCDGNPKKGLTKLGKSVIRFLNKKGAIIDLSHTNHKTFFDIMNAIKTPVVVTHANAFDICKSKRNLKKDQIQKIKEKKGFMGVIFSSKLVSKKKNAEIKDLIVHIDYLKNLIGDDNLGLGSDFGGNRSGSVRGLENVFNINNLFEALRQKKYPQAQIKKIAGGNILKTIKKILPP